MKKLTFVALATVILGMGSALAAEDHNSTRSNEGQVNDAPALAAPADQNTTPSNRSAAAATTVDGDSAMMSGSTPPRDAASGMATGKR
ncbi:MAG: hypothetical protein E2O92_08365 [Alphaproteobacteria bacterium]|nr:MAG: hypothetical protein E2O92_08365 [Alphaproteobacteria bacterium]